MESAKKGSDDDLFDSMSEGEFEAQTAAAKLAQPSPMSAPSASPLPGQPDIDFDKSEAQMIDEEFGFEFNPDDEMPIFENGTFKF